MTTSTPTKVRALLPVTLAICPALEVLGIVELSLGWISMDRFVGMLLDGATITVAGVVVCGLASVWSRLTWLRAKRRMRHNIFGPLGGTPRYAAEGWTSPVDAAGPETSALPGSSSVADFASYQRRR